MRGPVAGAAAGSAVLAGSWAIAVSGHDVPGWEARLFRWVNDLPAWLWPLLRVPMQLGSVVGALIVSAVVLLVCRRRPPALATLGAALVAWRAAGLVKAFAARDRPVVFLDHVHVRDHTGGYGFVSGHTSVAFAMAAALAPSLPKRWRPVAFGLATIVGIARVDAGAHLPLDVIGGAGLGLAAGTLVGWAVSRTTGGASRP